MRKLLQSVVLCMGCVAAVASSELGPSPLIVSCTDRPNTGACVQHDLTEAEDQEAARADVESACGMTGDGDGAVFAESECTPGIAACDGATGTLESTGEAVPIKVVWYAEACDLFVDNSGTCTSLGGTFSGTACTPP